MTDTTAAFPDHSHAAPGELVALIDQQIDLYATLDELSKRQHSIVETDDTDALLRVLADRQDVIARISGLAASLAPFRADWDANINRLDEDERARIRRRLADLAVVMEQIARRDEHDRDVIEQRRSSISAEIGGAKRSGAAMQAYGGQPKGPRFQDRDA
ncbi:MAG: flagellar export chaperone FlgN [Planctomycetota bacterium]